MDIGSIKRVLIGEPFPNSMEIHERLDKIRGLAIFASDPISSNAYATEAIMSILIVLGSGALSLTLPLALGIAGLVTIVIFSYVQIILHYPKGGGLTCAVCARAERSSRCPRMPLWRVCWWSLWWGWCVILASLALHRWK